jgi:hydrogenase nickel incorporation protein HypB
MCSESQTEMLKLDLHANLQAGNEDQAQKNRLWFYHHGINVFNLISSPGSGKTLLLEKTLLKLKEQIRLAVIVGDQWTQNDAERIQKTAVPVKQINTHSVCHLDAVMIANQLNHFVHDLEPKILFIENVGNLVCPAAFDLGETAKVALISTTEGEDKPQKYPLLFRDASVILITKIDLLPYLDWDLNLAFENIKRLNSRAPIFCLSAKTGEGLSKWTDWLLASVLSP